MCSFQIFYDHFLQICEEHKANDRALLFAFILYDFENAQMAKILNDKDYWLSLDTISGKHITVFSLHHKPKVRYKRKSKFLGDDVNMHNMLPISDFNNPSESTNSLIGQYFGNIEVKYPAVLFFQVNGPLVVDHILIELKEETIESAFLELKAYIKSAVDTLKLVKDENKGNHKEIFELVRQEVKSIRSMRIIGKNIRKLTSLTELTSSILGLNG